MTNFKKIYVSPEMELTVVDEDILTLSLEDMENSMPDVDLGDEDND